MRSIYSYLLILVQGGWCMPNHQPSGDLEPTQGRVDLNSWSENCVEQKAYVQKRLGLRTKTISVIPTGANGNIGNTGPRESVCVVYWYSIQ